MEVLDLDPKLYKYIAKSYFECKEYAKTANKTWDVDVNNETISYCPMTFDVLLCWGPTKVNSVAWQNCPEFVAGYDKNLLASKICLPNGTWYRDPNTGEPWTNYTTCINKQESELHAVVNDIYSYGYGLSLATLIISLIIFLSFRSLNCTRIRIHVQLFMSLAMNCILWILWYKLVVDDANVTLKNPMWCIFLHIVIHYFMMCNYFWMFCEGLHLHLVLVVVFIKDNVAMRCFYVIGWVLPLAFVATYSIFRYNIPHESIRCWMDDSQYMYILVIPVVISLFASIVFLIHIVRVLLMKLHPKSERPAPVAIKKAVRATLILIPLFGLQHILMPFRPEGGSNYEALYLIISAIIISLQGFCVSLLFCFANHEVIIAVLSHLNHFFPGFFPRSFRGSHYAPPATTTRDIVV